MVIQKIYIGGWFQRTTLHLTEVWDFLKHAKSNLDFPQQKLAEMRDLLNVTEISRETDRLEYILAKTGENISYRIYEDGLIVLEKEFEVLDKDLETIKDYYDDRLSQSLSYIFSKGAPVPKELANIKTILPYIITTSDAEKSEIAQLFQDHSQEIYSTLSTKNVEVYRSPEIILINNLQDEKLTREIIESQIFFREFKSQLHRYLTIHRIIWDKIQKIKERGVIKGTDVDQLRNELGVYQKTVNLIGSRIDQMDTYVRTRQKITDSEKVDDYLKPLFQFKFETLLDTQVYIKHLWVMTNNYLKSAIELFTDLQAKSTKNTISSLQLITTIGVVSGLIGYLGRDALPKFTSVGLIYFAILMFLTYLVNSIVSRFYKNKKYDIKGQEIEKNIK